MEGLELARETIPDAPVDTMSRQWRSMKTNAPKGRSNSNMTTLLCASEKLRALLCKKAGLGLFQKGPL